MRVTRTLVTAQLCREYRDGRDQPGHDVRKQWTSPPLRSCSAPAYWPG